MGEVAQQIFLDKNLKKINPNNGQIGTWVIMDGGDDLRDSESMESSYEDSSANSGASSSESDIIEYATSSSPSSSLSHSNGPLYELSELMLQLPIKRGLSKYYQGKSQSYTSLASVKSIEDLAKKGASSYSKRMKSCKKSYAGCGLDGHKFYSAKATISKKTPRGSFLSLLGGRSGKHPISVQNNF